MPLGQYQPTNTQPSVTSSIPWWGWVAGIGVIIVLFLVVRGGNQNQPVVSGGNTSQDTQSLAMLESGLEALLAQSGDSSSGNGGGMTGGSAGDGLTNGGGSDPAPIRFIGPPIHPNPSPSTGAGNNNSNATGPATRIIERPAPTFGPGQKQPGNPSGSNGNLIDPRYAGGGGILLFNGGGTNPTQTVTSSRTSNQSFLEVAGNTGAVPGSRVPPPSK